MGELNNGVRWAMDVGFRSLTMIIIMYSFQGCEKIDITSLCSVTACKFPFSIQGPKMFMNSRTCMFLKQVRFIILLQYMQPEVPFRNL
jgi:hypothetical protein